MAQDPSAGAAVPASVVAGAAEAAGAAGAADDAQASPEALGAVADWYHAQFTGLILFLIGRRSVAQADRFVYELFSHQREQKFLAGLKKLELDHLPHAVAAARYHFLSNWIGGVAVECMVENDRKAWIRYAPPRWVWAGTALCAVPSSVTHAMLAGWHARNGLSLGNPRLGFVCTKMTTSGDAGLEGYYFEADHDLAPAQRLRFAPDEDGPDFDPVGHPLPTATWPPLRLQKARRNYAMEYLRSAYVVGLRLWGREEALQTLGLSARLIGMQFFHETARRLQVATDGSAVAFAEFIRRFAAAQGDRVTSLGTAGGKAGGPADVVTSGAEADAAIRLRADGWHFAEGIEAEADSLSAAWTEGWVGALQAHNRRLGLEMEDGPASAGWTLSIRGAPGRR